MTTHLFENYGSFCMNLPSLAASARWMKNSKERDALNLVKTAGIYVMFKSSRLLGNVSGEVICIFEIPAHTFNHLSGESFMVGILVIKWQITSHLNCSPHCLADGIVEVTDHLTGTRTHHKLPQHFVIHDLRSHTLFGTSIQDSLEIESSAASGEKQSKPYFVLFHFVC